MLLNFPEKQRATRHIQKQPNSRLASQPPNQTPTHSQSQPPSQDNPTQHQVKTI